jgi:hypothetical protein
VIFSPTNPAKVRQQQLYEAERLQLEHAAAAEHHQALADMYAARIKRLQALEAMRVAAVEMSSI